MRATLCALAVTSALLTAGPPASHADSLGLVTDITIADSYAVCASAYHEEGLSMTATLDVTGVQQDGLSTVRLNGQREGSGTFIYLCTPGGFEPTTGVVYVQFDINLDGIVVSRTASCLTLAGSRSCNGDGGVSM